MVNSKDTLIQNLTQAKDLWVFGYGSLMWNPGFKYCEDRIGYINGFSRKFYQGNVTHRGRPGNPGRVVTLIEDTNSRVWGRSFHVIGQSQVQPCLDHLGFRECMLGGYNIDLIDFYICDNEGDEGPADTVNKIAEKNSRTSSNYNSKNRKFKKQTRVTNNPKSDFTISTTSNSNDSGQMLNNSTPTNTNTQQQIQNQSKHSETNESKIEENPKPNETKQVKNPTVEALVFIAVPNNHLYLGPAPSSKLAECIMNCEGASGSNLDYMLGILEFLQECVPKKELKFEREFLEIEKCIWNSLKRNEFCVATNYREHRFVEKHGDCDGEKKFRGKRSNKKLFVVGDSDGENDNSSNDDDDNDDDDNDNCYDDDDVQNYMVKFGESKSADKHNYDVPDDRHEYDYSGNDDDGGDDDDDDDDDDDGDDDEDEDDDDGDDDEEDDDDRIIQFSPLLKKIKEDASFIKTHNLKCIRDNSSSLLSSLSSSSSSLTLSSASSSSLSTITPCPSLIFQQKQMMLSS